MIKWIIILVVVLLVLSALGYSLPNLINSPTTQTNFSYVWNAIVNVWNNYLKVPAEYAWNILIVYIWEPAIHNLEQQKVNQTLNSSPSTMTLPAPAPTVQ